MTTPDEKKLPTREQLDSLKNLLPLDCGDNSCQFAPKKGGMRTNGGCRCVTDLKPFSKRLAVTRALQALPSLLFAAEERERLSGVVELYRAMKLPNGTMVGAVFDERDALRARLAAVEAEQLEDIRERYALFDLIEELAIKAGCDSEWSSEHDHRECLRESIEDWMAAANAEARRVDELTPLAARLSKIEELARSVGYNAAIGHVHVQPLLDAIIRPTPEETP